MEKTRNLQVQAIVMCSTYAVHNQFFFVTLTRRFFFLLHDQESHLNRGNPRSINIPTPKHPNIQKLYTQADNPLPSDVLIRNL